MLRLRAHTFDVAIGQGHGGAFGFCRRFVRRGGWFVWHEYWCGVPTRGDHYESYERPQVAEFSRPMLRMIRRLDAVVTGSDLAAHNLTAVQGVTCPIAIVPPLTGLSSSVRFPVRDRTYSDGDVLHIGMVGRHGVGKGTTTLISLWSDLRVGPAVLHLYGPFEDKMLERSLTSAAASVGTIKLHGPFERSELPRILSGLDLGLMLSVEEGYGLVLSEYMAAGVPFLATDTGAAPDLARDNPDALVVPVSAESVRDGMEALVRRIRSGGTSRSRLAARHVERYDPARWSSVHVRAVLDPAQVFVNGCREQP
jgi:glycosyltransferase involved in cell wall biosynthesis